ncbi:MAG: UDP-N-acetylmuramoyl-tripeptide--D-alanyl-D-alanine ligase, partial [Bacteroidales bacterium]|nr:UDP-N-acetylmuramoyl-tripeptide--D-alanyl-D-alanine ligase [Bacteroidales bacterium]
PNVLAAIAIADYFGVARKDSIAAIEAYTPSNQRSQLVRTERNTLIVDAYNANPSSMRLAIENLCSLRASGKLALLGDMRELGSASLQEHVEIVRLLTAQKLPSILVGEEFAKALAHCGITPGEGCILASFDSSESLAKHLEDNPVSAYTILVKGSRGIRMEKVIPAL